MQRFRVVCLEKQCSQAQQRTPVKTALGRCREEDGQLGANLDYRVRLCHHKNSRRKEEEEEEGRGEKKNDPIVSLRSTGFQNSVRI